MIIDATGAIICGGDSTRFGKDKRTLLIGKESFLEVAIKKISAICKEVLIAPRQKNNVTMSKNLYKKLKIIEDEKNMHGPIAGVIASLKYASYENILILGCDFPLISVNFLRYLLEVAQNNPQKIIVPEVKNVIQPLVGVYKKNCIVIMIDWVQKNHDYSLKNFLRYNLHDIYVVKMNKTYDLEKELFNVNTPADYEQLKKFLKVNKKV